MKIRDLAIAASAVLALYAVSVAPALAQSPPGGFPSVVKELRAAPGCLGVETGQTAGGRRVIFAWFDGKKSLVDWYHSDVHQRAMHAVFPNRTFNREPLPDLPEDVGPILTIVSVKFAEAPAPGKTAPAITSIGIELYGPLPGGVAVGGRFAPDAVKVRGLREFAINTALEERR